jgi:hypothetical protein
MAFVLKPKLPTKISPGETGQYSPKLSVALNCSKGWDPPANIGKNNYLPLPFNSLQRLYLTSNVFSGRADEKRYSKVPYTMVSLVKFTILMVSSAMFPTQWFTAWPMVC